MLSVIQIIVKDSSDLLKCMEESLSIYDQALYFQRQEYFRGKKNNEKYKVYNYNALWKLVKETQSPS